MVYCGWLIIELVFVVTHIVETRGRTLEETAALFDGEEPEQDLVQMGGDAATMTMGRATAIERRISEEKSRPVGNDFVEMSDMSHSEGSSGRRRSDIAFVDSRHPQSELYLDSLESFHHAV